MFRRRQRIKKYQGYLWLMGFLGLVGFNYFFSKNIGDLFFFSYFGFFATWFTYRLAQEMPDERYEENRLKAIAATIPLPLLVLFVARFLLAQQAIAQEWIVVLMALGWSASLFTYAIAFWYFEKH